MSSFAEYNSAYPGYTSTTFTGITTQIAYPLLSPGSGTVVGPIQTDTSQNVVGTIFATVSGVALIQQSNDYGNTWDDVNTLYVTSGSYTYNYPVIGSWARVVYTNGSNAQTGAFRLICQARTTGIV